ncbi:adenosylcobinamide-GDP ribazoletransferase [Clostridiales Family XIII bacterium PM5-7]
MNYIIGFFMAWGNFITLPCPYKRWESNLKNMMLAFLPSVGIVVGGVWMALYWVCNLLELPPLIVTIVMEFSIFAICGFMHMDGFMDCNDAIMSRRPLEERQRILKDSTVGAFAVVTVVFLLLGWFAAMASVMIDGGEFAYGDLLLIPVISRGIGGLCVLTFKPIGHSQYASDYKEPGRVKYRLAILGQVAAVVALSVWISPDWVKTIASMAVMAVTGLLACTYARKQLGGMSGDIAGYAICFSEFAGILALAIL